MPNARFDFHGSKSGTQLFVLIHGWEHSAANLADLCKTVRSTFRDADILTPSYPASTWSNGDLVKIADECAHEIDNLWAAHARGGYGEIVLIGHSLGALVARKIYLIAHGKYPEFALGGTLNPERHVWAPRLTRLVLLAGMNRGWSLWPKNPYTPIYRWAGRGVLLGLACLTRRGKLVRSARRGSEFVVNLRLDWLDLMHELGDQGPLVVQLAGTQDTVVHPQDHIDVQAGRTFRYLRIEGTSHPKVIQFDSSAEGRERRTKFIQAITKPAAELQSDLSPDIPRPDPNVQSVVLLLHGIRDFAHWIERLAPEIEAGAESRRLTVQAVIYKYGYLALLPFLCGIGRRTTLRRFMDRYAEARAAYPNATCSFLGHSNGTYLLASALRSYRACYFHRVVFAGSIVSKNFPWLRPPIRGRVVQLRNYVASDDMIVALFPSFFEKLRLLPFNRDFGSAGHNGFDQVNNNIRNIEFIGGGHGCAVQEANWTALVSFLLGDQPEVRPDIIPAQSWRAKAAYSWCLFLWPAMLVLVFGLFAVLMWCGGRFHWPAVTYLAILVWLFFQF